MATNVHLTPELERFARESVKEGRYNNVSEVVRSALRLLQESEEQRRQFRAMLQEVEDETARDGGAALEDVLAEMDEIIASSRR